MGRNSDPVYALEGSVATAGSAVKWLVENLNIVDGFNSMTAKINCVEDTNGICFVPAFSGLYAPYWKSDARGSVVLIVNKPSPNHLSHFRDVLSFIMYLFL